MRVSAPVPRCEGLHGSLTGLLHPRAEHRRVAGQNPAAAGRKEKRSWNLRIARGAGAAAGIRQPAVLTRPRRLAGHGIRHVRRMSNWTAAALIAGTGAATIALAHNAVPSAVPHGGTRRRPPGPGPARLLTGSSGPQVTHSVATTSGSGVTVTTTTHTVNGKTVVTHVRHAAGLLRQLMTMTTF